MNQPEDPIQKVKMFWDGFSVHYSKFYEGINLQKNISLVNMLGITKQKCRILEIACGSGDLALNLLPQLVPGTQYISLDLSDKMIEKANAKKANLSKTYTEIEHKFVSANGEDLSAYKDESFDIVFAPLVLHLTPNPSKMLQEAFRVLKKGGKFGCSVLGELKYNSFLTVSEEVIMKELNIPIPDGDGIFCFGKREKLMDLVSQNGFKIKFCWLQDAVADIQTCDEMLKQLQSSFETGPNFANATEEQKQRIVEGVLKNFQQKCLDTQKPLCIQSNTLTAFRE